VSETLPKDSAGKTTVKNTAEHASYGRTRDDLLGRRIIIGSPEAGFLYMSEAFKEPGGSQSLAIDGSVTPVLFEAGPPDGETWFIDKLAFFIGDTGTINSTDFGAIVGGLTNGLLLDAIIKGATTNLGNFKINTDISEFYIDEFAELEFADVGTSFRVSIRYNEPIVLIGGPTPAGSEFFRFTVRDDISPVNRLSSVMTYHRKVF